MDPPKKAFPFLKTYPKLGFGWYSGERTPWSKEQEGKSNKGTSSRGIAFFMGTL